ncbi:HDOD domain-containing protein [Candidatus Ferrigenium straubiae]|mgnify:CR=1 FL=1|jgi:putative nucleotidyltransferase with HDIG domain|uniref:HDOD domain-containing protein n=1 Tax=Candidatus Ferrigenium straubiae TaxID=2919506 RepID=UPI003F4AA56F
MTDESIRLRLKQALANLDSLPAMPDTAQKLLALPLDTDEGEAQMLKLIEQDPQISAKIISLANSPVMGIPRKLNKVSDAAMLLGLTRVKSVAVGIASMSHLAQSPAGKYFKAQDLWLHSMTVAIVMHTIAQAMPRDTRPNEDQIFLTGLLHDIGFMALHHIDAEASDLLHHQLLVQSDRPILEVELETLGITHCYIGAQLGRHWHLPEELITVLGYHHPPYVEEAAPDNPLVRLVSLSEKIAPNYGIAEHTGGEIQEYEWVELGIAPADVEDICAQANELAVQTAQFSGDL